MNLKSRVGVVFASAFILIFGAQAGGVDQTLSDPCLLLGDMADWQPQDYPDSQGVIDVRFDAGQLALTAHLDGQHPNYKSGEVYLDFKYFPCLECKTPIDMSGRTINVTVVVPDPFSGSLSAPNGVQVFVKDDQWRAQYSKWQNATECEVVPEGRRCRLTLRPTTGQIAGGFTAPGFDPARVNIIGVKFGINSQSAARYDGSLFITEVNVEPTLPTAYLCESLPKDPPRAAPVGGSWRGLEYGQNFGKTKWFPSGNGFSRHPNFVRLNLECMRRAGVSLIRVGLLDDGRVLFDKDGHVVGYDEMFRQDVQKLLDLARDTGIQVEFALFDFLVAGKAEEVEGVWVRGRSAVLTDPLLRAEFMEKFLVPFLQEFGRHPALGGIDAINEPEWIVSVVDGGAWEDVKADDPTKAVAPIPGATLKSFLRETLATIRQLAPSKPITVGVSAKFLPLVTDLDMDYYALHHYPWMYPLEEYLPLLPPGKPWALEEFPTCKPTSNPACAPQTLSITAYLDMAWAEGARRALLWNLAPAIDNQTYRCGERDTVYQELRRWVEAHPWWAEVSTLTWTNPPGTTQYYIQIIPYNDDGPAINLIRNVKASYVVQPPVFGQGNYVMLPGMTYSWRVRATSKSTFAPEGDPSWGPWSDWRTFRTPAPSSATISPVFPTNGINLASAAPVTLQWANTATDIFYYEVQVSPDLNFGERGAVASVWHNLVHGGVTTPVNSWTTPELLPRTTYYWRIRPRVQGDGTPVAWSAIWSFKTP